MSVPIINWVSATFAGAISGGALWAGVLNVAVAEEARGHDVFTGPCWRPWLRRVQQWR